MESLFSKVTKFLESANQSKTLHLHLYVPESSFFRNFEKHRFKRVAGLQSAICNALENEIKTKFLERIFRILEISGKSYVIMFLFSK